MAVVSFSATASCISGCDAIFQNQPRIPRRRKGRGLSRQAQSADANHRAQRENGIAPTVCYPVAWVDAFVALIRLAEIARFQRKTRTFVWR